MRTAMTVSILFLCFTTGRGLLNQKPQDFVAIAGKSAYFNCSTSEPTKPILWYHYATNEAHRENIYQYTNFTDYWYPCYRKGRYVVERNPETGAFNLVIPMVLFSDEGRYLCEVEGDEGAASLTVQGYAIDSNLECVASEMCKPYSVAIVFIILIIPPISIGGTILVMWYLHVHRPKQTRQKKELPDSANEQEVVSLTTTQEENEGAENKQLASTNINLETEAYDDERQKKSDEMLKLKAEIETSDKGKQKLEREVIQLKTSINYLERCLYPTDVYVEKPTLIHIIITDAGNANYASKPNLTLTTTTNAVNREPINGIAVLDKELFVSHENNSFIQVYDTETYLLGSNLAMKGVSHPMDIASCNIANCLYIIFRGDSGSESYIMKLDPNGKLIKEWSTGGEQGRLSTYESNVIVCLSEKQVINEYTKDGNQILTVPLSPVVGFNHPWHAIKVTSSHFVVCHGDAKDELHRVCIVDDQGRIVKESRDWESKQKDGKLNVPICLAADSKRSILVADRDNQKIRLLNCHLRLQRNLIKQEVGLDGHPVRMCLDETKGRLFVAANTIRSDKKEWGDGRILIFNVM